MMSREEMIKRIDEYFERTTPEQFEADLKEMNCINSVEDVGSTS